MNIISEFSKYYPIE